MTDSSILERLARGNLNSQQSKIEFIKEYQNCSLETIDVIQNIDPDKFDDINFKILLTKEPGTEGKLESIACLINSWKNNPENLTRLYQGIRKLNEGGYGQVFMALNGELVSFLIKEDLQGVDNVIHESFVGLALVNKLRKSCPNFVYTYGTLFCSEDKTNGWCSEAGSKPYLLIENIPNVQTFQSVVKNLTKAVVEGKEGVDFTEIYGMILQLLSALNFANQVGNFTHYDLHDTNVLIQTLPEEIDLPLYLGDTPEVTNYFRTRYLVRIIDYGLAYCEIKGKKIFPANNQNQWETFDKYYPVRDVASILVCIRDDVGAASQQLFEDYNILQNFVHFLTELYGILGRDINKDVEMVGENDDYQLILERGVYYSGSLFYNKNYLSFTPKRFIDEFLLLLDNFGGVTTETSRVLERITDRPDVGEYLPTGLCKIPACQQWDTYESKLFPQVSSDYERSVLNLRGYSSETVHETYVYSNILSQLPWRNRFRAIEIVEKTPSLVVKEDPERQGYKKLQDLLPELDAKNFLITLLQIYRIFDLINKTNDFTHYDLTVENVWLVPVSNSYFEFNSDIIPVDYEIKIDGYQHCYVSDGDRKLSVDNPSVANEALVFPLRDLSTLLFTVYRYAKPWMRELCERLYSKLQRDLVKDFILTNQKPRNLTQIEQRGVYGTFYNGYLVYDDRYPDISYNDICQWIYEEFKIA